MSLFFFAVSLEWIRQGQATGKPSKLVDGWRKKDRRCNFKVTWRRVLATSVV